MTLSATLLLTLALAAPDSASGAAGDPALLWRDLPQRHAAGEAWLVVPSDPSAGDSTWVQLLAPSSLDAWFRAPDGTCGARPEPSRAVADASARAYWTRASSAGDTLLAVCAVARRAGPVWLAVKVTRSRAGGGRTTAVVQAREPEARKAGDSRWDALLPLVVTAGLTFAGTVLGFFLQESWRRAQDRVDRHAGWTAAIAEKLYAEMLENERKVDAYLAAPGGPLPRLQAGGYRDVVLDSDVVAHLRRTRGQRYVDSLRDVYRCVFAYDERRAVAEGPGLAAPERAAPREDARRAAEAVADALRDATATVAGVRP